jgi:MFS family permease
LNAALRWFLLGMIIANTASQMVFVFLPVYLTKLGADVAEVGLVFSLASLVPIVLQIFGGWLSDSIGRLRTIALGAVAASLGYIGFVFAPSWEWMIGALCLEYISGALVGPSFSAFIAEQSSEETRGRVYGITGAIYLVVGVIGPILGGFLAERYGFQALMAVACVLYLSAAALRVWMATAERFTGSVRTEALSLASLRSKVGAMAALLLSGGVITWVFITDGVRDIAFRLSHEMEPLYFAQVGEMSIEQIGWLSAIFSTAVMLVSLPAGWITDRQGERVTIAAGFFLQFTGLTIFLFSSNFWGFALAVTVTGLGEGLLGPAFNSFVSKIVPDNMRGMAFGLFQTSLGVISLPAPWLGGQLWQRFGPRTPFAITALALLLCVIPVLTKFRQPETRQVYQS